MKPDIYVDVSDSFSDKNYLGIKDQIIAEWLFEDKIYGICCDGVCYDPRTDYLFRLKVQHFNTEKELREKLCQNLLDRTFVEEQLEFDFMNEKGKCCLCGKALDDEFGNNAEPLKKGKCCNKCNAFKVIPARINLQER
jgi:hypothetical protein